MAVDTDGPKKVLEEFNGPVSTYQVVEAKPLTSDARFVASDPDGEEEGQVSAPAAQRVVVNVPTAKRAMPQPAQKRVAKLPADQVEADKPERSSTKMYIALGAGLGVLTALAVVAFVILPGKPVDTSYDMGSVTSTSNGLKGHLITSWGDRLNYKLTLEPSDTNQIDAFATTISNPPQAIEVNLQLKDVTGTVLCQNPVLLKFDPLRNIPNVVTRGPAINPKSKNAAAEEMAQNQAEIDQSLNKARLVSQELSREHGKDIFQPVTGDDGQVSSLAAQGTMPCTKKQYQSAASWSFVTNFPSVIQSGGPGGSDANDNLEAFGVAPGHSESGSNSEHRFARRAPLPNSHFSVEEDDALVGYQAATGIAETRAGKSFLVEKRDLVASALKGAEFPIPIHYRCDQLGACALAGLNSGVQRAWLER